LEQIANILYPYHDAVGFGAESIAADIYYQTSKTAGFYTSVITDTIIDWTEFCASKLNEMVTLLCDNIQLGPKQAMLILGCTLVASSLYYLKTIGEDTSVPDALTDLVKHRDNYSRQYYEAQSEVIPDFVSVSKNHCFFVSVTSTINDKRVTINTQCTMSGKYILVNDHAVGSNPIVNVYKDWDAYQTKNMMFNNLPVVVQERLLTEDLAILRVDRFPVSPMKVFKWALDEDVDFFKSRELYCINSDIVKPVKDRCNCKVNSFIVKYKMDREYTMYPQETISYDMSAKGLCGSLLVSEAGIPMGHHVAGNTDTGEGVIKLWTRQTREKLKAIFNGKDSQYAPIFKPLENFSGMRFMQTDLKTSRCLNKSGFRSTVLHSIREDDECNAIIKELETNAFVIPKQLKAPANLAAYGNKTLKEMAKKSYKPIPQLDQKEIDFAKECIASQMIKFGKISDLEAAFGNDNLTEMNRKSVNGYDYEKEKKLYFDYEAKVIKPIFYEKLAGFKKRALDDELLVSDILCVEALKDELRPIEKVNKPRSYRILPLHHTFLLKQYVAKLFVHMKNNMWTNGICIGMNPYMDFNELYRKLQSKFLHFDGDFGKYDGSAPSQLQDAIAEVVMDYFVGTLDDTKIFRILLDSCIRSYVLTNEELFLTTHSLPSGCWITAFFNSLLNKMLTAICLKRFKPNATVAEWQSIMDYVLGDDKLVGVPKALSEFVNALRMKDVAESLGMEYTDAKKGEITTKGKPLEECQFLKRTFLWNSDLQKRVGALDINTIVETLRFFDSSKVYEEAMDGKMTAIQFELFLYGHHGEPILKYLKDTALNRDITFREYEKSHIMKSMLDPSTYANLLAIQDKFNPN